MNGPRDPESLYFDASSYFRALIASLDQARESIDFEVYIFELGETGKRVLDALERAAHRGVRVRLLVDGFGSYGSVERIMNRLAPGPVQFKVFRPLLLPASRSQGSRLDALRRLGRRNHRKSCLIDGRCAWVGSFNVSDRPWRDSAICIRGHAFVELALAFERAWCGVARGRRAQGHGKLGPKTGHFLLNDTAQLRRKRNLLLARKISRARRRVWVTTPYFTPDHRILRALRRAARAGADVRILLPERPDVPGMSWINSVFCRLLGGSGLKIHLYRPSVLHAKTLLADDWGIVGSSNLNHRSLLQDLEVDAVAAQSMAQRMTDQLALWIRGWT
jgi:cardiolipin synthase